VTGIPPIELLAIGDSVPEPLLLHLRELLQGTVGTPVCVAPPFHPPAFAAGPWDRVSSNRLIDALIERSGGVLPRPPRWVVGITPHDLVAPGRAFVFGEATLGGAWTVISLARLLPPGHRSLDRLHKEVVHELGHLAGLDHCSDARCVMHPSTTTASIDSKCEDFCPECGSRFRLSSRS
jgi:hypothetical protein